MSLGVLEATANPYLPRSRDQQSLSLLLQKPLKLHQLKQIQAQLLHRSLHQDNILITKLINSCSNSGTMDYASLLFNSITNPDLILCNSMLKAYTHNNLMKQALLFYIQMLQTGISPDLFTFPYVFKACAALSAAGGKYVGRGVHAWAAKTACAHDVFVLNSLIDMYLKCGNYECAMQVFRRIQEPNSTSWNIMIGNFVNSGDLEYAKQLFDEMPERDVVSWNTMMSGYAKAGRLGDARQLFDGMPKRNLVSWNALIAALAQHGEKEEALTVFSQMLESGVEPDNTTMLSVISALAGIDSPDSDAVYRIVGFAKESGLANSVSVSTAILNVYAKFGKIDEARELFDKISEKDLVCWNTMIGGYSQNKQPVKAIELFRQMQSAGVTPDELTMVSVIASCSQLGALGLGEWVHAYMKKKRLNFDVFLATALVDMYAKCGDLNYACQIFDEMPIKDLASWNAMIKGFAVHGQGKEALHLFSLMEKEGVIPNSITFVGLLSACSHEGLVADGLELFDSMQSRYGIVPHIEHYGCVVDLLGRVGRLVDAYEFVKKMPIEPDAIVWGSLLSACGYHVNTKLAEAAAQRLVELDPGHDGNYVLLSNVYASAGNWAGVERVRARMRARNVRKTPGCSSVELGGLIHEFLAGDRTHERTSEIYAFWDKLVEQIKPMGYLPDKDSVLRNLDEEDKEEALYRHSEKLAVSFALISTEARTPIRIVKNLRICADCHQAMELVSQLVEREITIRDRNRFHHFRSGHCSCNGYW